MKVNVGVLMIRNLGRMRSMSTNDYFAGLKRKHCLDGIEKLENRWKKHITLKSIRYRVEFEQPSIDPGKVGHVARL